MEVQKRAYSLLEIKSVDEEKRIITGIATTPKADLMEDVVEPDGAEFKLPIPLLWQHDSSKPIGHVVRAKVTKSGIEVEAHLVKVNEAGTLKDRLDEAWQSIKAGLVRGLSIGFRSLEEAEIKGTYGYRYIKWLWLELSAVTIPANSEATVTAVKSIDKKFMAASGRKSTNSPGVSGKSTRGNRTMKTIQEKLAELNEARQVKFARMNEISELVKTESRDFSDEEAAEFDDLEAEVKQLDGDIRMKKVEAMNAQTARAVDPTPNRKAGSLSRGAGLQIINKTDQDEKFQGQNFTRKIIAKAVALIEGAQPWQIAEKRWGRTNPTLVELIKVGEISAGDAGTTAAWAANLVAEDGRYTGDFIEYLKSKTIYDQLPMREVPANVTIKGQDGVATAYWVAEGLAIPPSESSFTTLNLAPLKVAAVSVVTNELLRDASPSAEMLVRDSLATAMGVRIDTTFLGNAASANGAPMGIKYNRVLSAAIAAAANSVGGDATCLREDVAAAYAAFITAKMASGLYWIMNPALAKQIQLLTNALGIPEFDSINQNGGTLLGDPVVTGDIVQSDELILVKPSEIYKIGDSGIQVSVSREATLEMNSSPTMEGNTPAAATNAMVNMFQTESTAIKLVRSVNFMTRRAIVCQWIDSCDYDGSAKVTTTAGT